jgi:hypothetical protein
MLEPAFLLLGLHRNKKPPLIFLGRRFHQNKTHLLLPLKYTTAKGGAPEGLGFANFGAFIYFHDVG